MAYNDIQRQTTTDNDRQRQTTTDNGRLWQTMTDKRDRQRETDGQIYRQRRGAHMPKCTELVYMWRG